MKPVVDRYIELGKYLKALDAETAYALRSVNMSRLSSAEIKRLRGYKKELKKALFDCQKQLEKAQLYHRWSKQNAAELAKILKTKKKFWE